MHVPHDGGIVVVLIEVVGWDFDGIAFFVSYKTRIQFVCECVHLKSSIHNKQHPYLFSFAVWSAPIILTQHIIAAVPHIIVNRVNI